mmetsp:Transcript_4068/g.8859  ORF Transcript_4068/g.8859 Transcript_4068/m.8859 type:complete len:100 (+) Transcript_4068:1911-2210(+)
MHATVSKTEPNRNEAKQHTTTLILRMKSVSCRVLLSSERRTTHSTKDFDDNAGLLAMIFKTHSLVLFYLFSPSLSFSFFPCLLRSSDVLVQTNGFWQRH